ncbi:MAG TPA: arylsulfotransferase family protein [Candidatus Micrarchaeia archaeon]|nr:arylsulfotransferase family protein [Candidatus Micrarchaeia archaeon]
MGRTPLLRILVAPLALLGLTLSGGAAAVRAGAATTHPAAARLAAGHCPGVSVYPSQGTPTASPTTQVSFRGLPFRRLASAPIQVTGSVSGVHTGRLVADSDGEGGSFFPSRAFAAGETVTVRTDFRLCGGRGDTVRFGIAEPAPALTLPSFPAPKPAPASDFRHYRSRPDLVPPTMVVTRDAAPSAGDILLTPSSLPGEAGPMIVDGHNDLVWFHPLARGTAATDLRVQRYRGQPVLTWWQGSINAAGHGAGVDEILNDHYQKVTTVRAGNGYHADLHEFLLDHGTAWLTAYNAVSWDMTTVGGPAHGLVWDAIVQAIDVATGNVLFEWHSLGHVAIDRTYQSYVGTSPFNSAADYFHVNTISPQPGGNVLISSRNTDAAYEVREASGNVLWVLGGKHSSFKMGPLTFFRLQHDVKYHPGGLVTIFDDEDQPPGRLHARGLELRLDTRTMTATLIHQWIRRPALTVPSQGNTELLPDGNVFVGWGAQPDVTEFTAGGRMVFDAHLPLGFSYRAYRAAWSAEPATRPAVAAVAGARHRVTCYASWNGATGVARWQVLGGSGPRSLRPIATVAKRGFETPIAVTTTDRFLAVRALDGAGRPLKVSRTVRPRAASAPATG